MPDPQAVQILTTLEYLGQYNTVHHFGVILQTSVGSLMPAGNLTVSPAIQNLLQPWMWWDPAKPQPAAPAGPSSPLNIQQFPVQLWQTPDRPSNATPILAQIVPVPMSTGAGFIGKPFQLDPSLTSVLANDCLTAINSKVPGDLQWSPDSVKGVSRSPGKNTYPWPAHLAQVARYPYPIPHLLNLCFFLKVTDANFKPNTASMSYFATLNFSTAVSGATVTYNPPVVGQFPDVANNLLVLPLDNPASAADHSMAITTKLLTGPLIAATKVIQSTTDHTPETTDWQAHLASSVADTFDLSARIVNTVRSACDQADTGFTAKVAADFTGLVTSVLTAQREIVAYGCQTGANGQSLLKRLLNAWLDANPDQSNVDFANAFHVGICAQRATDQSDLAHDLIAYYNWIDTLSRQEAFRGNDLLPTLRDGPTVISPAGLTPFDSKKIYLVKDKPAVIFNQLPYLAIADVGPAASVDSAHWRCLLPSIAFYDPAKTYYGGEQVLFNDKLYQAPTSAAGTTTAPPAAPWLALSAFAPGVQAAKLPDKLLAVEHLQLQFTQPDVLSKLLLQQWQDFFNVTVNSDAIQSKMPADKSASAAFQSFLASATANLAQWDVRGLLLQCNLNTSWAKITSSASTRDSLRSTIRLQLNTRLGEGLLNKLPGAQGAAPSFAASILSNVDKWVDERISLIVPPPLDTSAGAAPAAGKADPQPTRAAQGLSVMVDTLLPNATDDQDPLRMISGLCVLMRQSNTTAWRCLNAGIPIATATSPLPDSALPAVQDPASPTSLGSPIIIPMPLHYQDGLHRAIFTYDNQPIMCSSPAHGFSEGLVPKPTRDQSRNFDRLISYQHLSVTQDLETPDLNAWKIPGLSFNRSYDFLFGAVSNSGALPPEFADPVLGPGVFSFAAVQSAKNATGKLLGSSIAAIPYRRTVPISDLRFASLDASGAPAQSGSTLDKLSLPAIPADVQPRANEVFGSKLLDDRRGKAQLATPNTPHKPSKPLLLLSPYFPAKSSYTLLVSKPTIDFLTWDRAQATVPDTDPSNPRNQRAWAWQLFNTHARKQDSNFDLSLEDYAIESLTLEAKDEKGEPIPCAGVSTLKWTDAKIQDPATATRLQTVQLPIQIKVSTSVGGNLKLQGQSAATPSDSPTFTLMLPPGFLGHIKLTANLKAASRQHFARNILPKSDGYEFLIETALADFPQATDLQKYLSIMPPLTADGPVQFTLTAPTAGSALARQWKQISRVDLQTQTWRWDGRPAPMFPFEELAKVTYYGGGGAWPVPMPIPTEMPVPAAQSATKKLLGWELEAFASRSADDYTVRPMARSNANFGAADDRGTELGATYYRAGVTAYNRYGSLLPTDNPSDGPRSQSAGTLNSFAGIPGADGAWVRRFVPGRYTADGTIPTHKDAAGNLVLDYTPPKPAIKYIVPLTGAFDASRPAASSVLVVLQGPWFAIAGLAEDISVRILTSDPQDHPYQLPEAGPDPIYYQSSRQLPSGYGPYGSPFIPVEPAGQAPPLFHGPVGHTFDSSDTNPLWVTSSFVLDPPSEQFNPPVRPGQDAAQEGTFACVQFARKILHQGMVETDSTRIPTALMPSTRGDLTSPYTDPVWVQFLPSRYLPVDSATDFSILTLHYDGLNQKVTLYDPSDRRNALKLTEALRLTHALHPAYIDAADYTFALLLTQQVPDLLGRLGQERFVDMLLEPGGDASDSACWKWPMPSGGVPRQGIDMNRLIGRIVVIQRQVNTTAKCDPKAATATKPICDLGHAGDLWTELFPKDPTQDAVSRIIAVSPPIPQFNSSAARQTCIVDSALNPTAAGGGK